MDNKIANISETVVLIFNILIYIQLTVPKKEGVLSKVIMYAGGGVSLIFFFVCTGKKLLPETLASFVCVTLPAFALFFILSKYKDCRFFVTFCFIDTVTLILTFFARAAEIKFGIGAGVAAYVLLCLIMLIFYLKGKKLFRTYRELMANVNGGWGVMALSALLIYILLIFAAAYPKPLAERTEYIPVYALLSVAVLSFYGVFLVMLSQKRTLADLNAQHMNEKKWHKIAYSDALTGLENRMAYMERINELARTADDGEIIHVVMLDIDNFKQINDTYGHSIGDATLRKAANFLREVFAEECYSVFRIGGDEFAAVSVGVSGEELQKKLAAVKSAGIGEDREYAFSVGCSRVELEENNAMDKAFERADREMYLDKMKNKEYVNAE